MRCSPKGLLLVLALLTGDVWLAASGSPLAHGISIEYDFAAEFSHVENPRYGSRPDRSAVDSPNDLPPSARRYLGGSTALTLYITRQDPIPYISIQRNGKDVATWIGAIGTRRFLEEHDRRIVVVHGSSLDARERSRTRRVRQMRHELAAGLTVWISSDARTRSAFRLSRRGDEFLLLPIPSREREDFDAPEQAYHVAESNRWRREYQNRSSEERQGRIAISRREQKSAQDNIEGQHVSQAAVDAQEQMLGRDELATSRTRPVPDGGEKASQGEIAGVNGLEGSREPKQNDAIEGEVFGTSSEVKSESGWSLWHAFAIAGGIVVVCILYCGASSRCPACSRWWAANEIASDEIDRLYSSRNEIRTAHTYNNEGRQIASTNYTVVVPIVLVSSREALKCQYCGHVWTEDRLRQYDA